jgi:hypothetical protein
MFGYYADKFYEARQFLQLLSEFGFTVFVRAVISALKCSLGKQTSHKLEHFSAIRAEFTVRIALQSS